MAEPAPEVTDDLEEGDDGAEHAFWAFVLRRRASLDEINDLERLARLIDAFDSGAP